MPAEQRKQNDTRFRMCRTLLKNGSLNHMKYGAVMKLINNCIKPYQTSESERILPAESFKNAIKLTKLGLSLVQIDDLITNFGGLDDDDRVIIDLDYFVRYMHYTRDRMDKEDEWKQDPRGKLCDNLLRLTPDDFVLPVVKQLHAQLQHDQLHRLKVLDPPRQQERRGSLNTSIGGSAAGSHMSFGSRASFQAGKDNVHIDADFDVTWAPEGGEVTMPPGSKPVGSHLVLEQGTLSEVLGAKK